jgi:hypothetical protein
MNMFGVPKYTINSAILYRYNSNKIALVDADAITLLVNKLHFDLLGSHLDIGASVPLG